MPESNAEIERLSNDIKTREDLKNQVQVLGHDTDAFVKWANGQGYHFDLNDLNSHIAYKTSHLTAKDQAKLAAAADASTNVNVGVNVNGGVTSNVGGVVVGEVAVLT